MIDRCRAILRTFALARIVSCPHETSRDMEKRMIVTMNDYQRLIGLIEFASLRARMPETISHLYKRLTGAAMVPQESVSVNVITMDSRVRLRDMSGEREMEVTLTYPQDADARLRKVSVFTPIGIALLGKEVGDIVSWQTPLGPGQFLILEITYQPEADGIVHGVQPGDLFEDVEKRNENRSA